MNLFADLTRGIVIPPFERRRSALLIAGICILALGGCKSAPPTPSDPEPELRQMEATGYNPERRYATMAVHEVWDHDGTTLDVSFIAPSASSEGSFPLIVYLPGLGESSAAGVVWRKAWAEAGYAVLAIQPAPLTEQVWASPLARQGEFRLLAKQLFSPTSAASRVKELGFALSELQRRAKAANSVYRAADISKIVMAGFDLGAQTVSIICGESAGDQQMRLSNVNVRSAIVLSPFFDGAARDARQRFSAMTLPVLSITGSADADPFSLLSTPLLRQVPWESMPPGEKYLLVIEGGTHAVLAGDGLFDADSLRASQPGNDAGTKQGGQGQSGRGRGRRGGGGALETQLLPGEAGNGSQPGDEAAKNPDQSRRDLRGGKQAGPQTRNLRQIAAIVDISTAFLDATAKAREAAREWLAQDAPRWLGNTAVFKVK